MIQEKKQLAKIKQFKQVFGTPEGERVLYDLMRFANMLYPSYSQGGTAEDCIYREGQRSVALYIVSKVKISEEKLSKLIEQGDKHV